MVSTPTTLLGFEKQGQSDNPNAWWDNLNQVIDVIDAAIASALAVATTGGDTALTVTPYAADESRLPIVRIAAGQTLSSNARVTAARKREYLVSNESASGDFTVSFGYDTSNVVVVPRGYMGRILNRADGTSKLVGALISLSTGEIYSGNIPDVTSDMLDATLAASITTAISNASSAVSTASSAAATAAATAALVVAATTEAAGISELATSAETITGTDAARTTPPAGVTATLDARTASDSATGLLEIAVQSEMEAASSALLAVTPGRLHYHPGVAKAWCNIQGSHTNGASYNVASVTDEGGGATVTYSVPFSSANYAISCSVGDSDLNWATGQATGVGYYNKLAGSCRLMGFDGDEDSGPTDVADWEAGCDFIAFGDLS